MNLGAIDYASIEVPAAYHCVKCPAVGVRLWRDYQTCADACELLCFHCAVARAGKAGDNLGDYTPDSSSIAWVVAAVPTEDGETFWGYSSVPAMACAWWYSMTPDRGSTPWTPEKILSVRVERLRKDVDLLNQLLGYERRSMACWIDRTNDLEERMRKAGMPVEDWRPVPKR